MNKFVEVPRKDDAFDHVDDNQPANVPSESPETYTKVGKVEYVKANAKPLGQGFLAGTIFGGLTGSVITATCMYGRFAKMAAELVDDDEENDDEEEIGTEESNDEVI